MDAVYIDAIDAVYVDAVYQDARRDGSDIP
jgi:AAA+ superfamily predicted ATPase